MSHDTEALVTRSYGGTTIEDVKTAQNVLGLNENNTFLNKEPYLGTSNPEESINKINSIIDIQNKRNKLGESRCSRYCFMERCMI
ncbi:hypothetical protein AGR56_05205 [Clostridium sp. DMHC 10]|uniref:hypothetical protein n=1 Tax=Clostridium sp. DMHC 10 TaxID=747377 RepID=UPI00069ED027|nr:hypothetical protein [Clostridium sp. DMHC 10]KOF56263.1 hypothetical protein AGR56_05205 [Clostridium sp. DMHC 10]